MPQVYMFNSMLKKIRYYFLFVALFMVQAGAYAWDVRLKIGNYSETESLEVHFSEGFCANPAHGASNQGKWGESLQPGEERNFDIDFFKGTDEYGNDCGLWPSDFKLSFNFESGIHVGMVSFDQQSLGQRTWGGDALFPGPKMWVDENPNKQIYVYCVNEFATYYDFIDAGSQPTIKIFDKEQRGFLTEYCNF